jgi:hypothetical protein
MPWFEIVYSEEPTSRALFSDKIETRDRTIAATVAMKGLIAQATLGAKCYRIIDGWGVVVARGPKGPSLAPSSQTSSDQPLQSERATNDPGQSNDRLFKPRRR